MGQVRAAASQDAGQRVDRPWAWAVALACCWIAFCNTGIYRSSGVLYVQIVQVFGVSREAAAWPFSLFGAVSSFAGVLPGLLVRRWSIRQIVLLGSGVTVVGVVACFFANSVFWIAFCFGGISGFGSGLIMTLLPVILNQYFQTNRATASGVFLSGATLSLMILPSMTESLLDAYALQGTFLVLSGVVLNIFVGALLLRPLPQSTVVQDTDSKPSINSSNDVVCFPSCCVSRSNDKEVVCCRICYNFDSGSNCCALRIARTNNFLKQCSQVLRDPMFLLITFCSITSRSVLVTFSLVLVDYLIDKGMTEAQGVLLISVVALPELAGRLGSGWISDHRFMKRTTVFLLAQLLSGLVLSSLTFAYSPGLLFTLSAVFALANAGSFILINVFYLEYLGMEKLPIALSLKNIFMGLASLLRPMFIGLFRDHIRSYDYLFHSLAIVSGAAGAIWLLEPSFLKKPQSRPHAPK